MKYIIMITAAYSLVLWNSCIKESSNLTNTIVRNESGHKIEIRLFVNDTVVVEHVKTIGSGTEQNVRSQQGWGKGKGFSYAIFLQPFDSVVVLYDDTVKAVHYTFNRVGNNPKAITFYNKRSLLNDSSYFYEVISESKRSIHNKYTYTFTEQDYLDAK